MVSEYKSSTTCPHHVLHARLCISEGEKGTVQHKNLVYSCTEEEHSPLMEKSRNLNVVQFFANQSLPQGSNIGLICKEGAQVTAGWQELGPQVQGAQYHNTQEEEDSRSSDVNQGQPAVNAMIIRQVHRNKASLMLSQVIRLARQGKDLHGVPTTQLRQGVELIFSS